MCLIAFQIVVSSAATIPGIFHLSGYILRFLLSPQMADKAQRHIYASRHAGGGEELAVFYPARIVDPADLVAHRDDPVKRYLIGGRPPAVQRATLGQQRGAGAYRQAILRLFSDLPEQNKEALVIGQRPRAPSAGDKPLVPQVLLRHSFGGNPDALPIADHAAILGKDTQTYTINGSHIYNKEGKEVFKADAPNAGSDRLAIFANLAVQQGRAVRVTHRGNEYVVNNKGQIISIASKKLMKWEANNGDRIAILEAAKNAFAAKQQAAQNPQEGNITSQLISHLQNIGIPVHTKEEAIKYLKEHGYDDITQFIEDNNDPYGPDNPYHNEEKASEEDRKEIRRIIEQNNYNKPGTDLVIIENGNSPILYVVDHPSQKVLKENQEEDKEKGINADGFGIRKAYKINDLTKEDVKEIIRDLGYKYRNSEGSLINRLQRLGVKREYLRSSDVVAFIKAVTSSNGGLVIRRRGQWEETNKGRNNRNGSKNKGLRSKVKGEFFLTPSGEVYGFVTSDGRMFLDETKINPEHPIHEYTHLWDAAVQRSNPELWKRGVQLMHRGASSLWNSIANDENYGKRWSANGIEGEELINLIASEVHSRLVGQKGAEFLDQMAKEKGKEGIISKLKDWILEFWKNLKATFSTWSKEDIDKLTLSDFNHMTVRDLAEGINPNTINPVKELLSSKQTTTDMTLSLPNFEHFVYDRTYDKLEGIKVDSSWKQQYLEKLDSHNNSRVA